MSDWQPIETAPRDGTIIWLGGPRSLCVGYWAGHTDKCWRNWFKGSRYENASMVKACGRDVLMPEPIWFVPTYWQPLPELPPIHGPVSADET